MQTRNSQLILSGGLWFQCSVHKNWLGLSFAVVNNTGLGEQTDTHCYIKWGVIRDYFLHNFCGIHCHPLQRYGNPSQDVVVKTQAILLLNLSPFESGLSSDTCSGVGFDCLLVQVIHLIIDLLCGRACVRACLRACMCVCMSTMCAFEHASGHACEHACVCHIGKVTGTEQPKLEHN